MTASEKQQIRRNTNRRVRELSEPQRVAAGLAVAGTIAGMKEWAQADALLAYVALADEVSLDPLIEMAAQRKLPVYVPVLVEEKHSDAGLEFRSIGSREGLVRHALGMLEPDASSALWRQATGHPLLLCPGRAFSRDGVRLGRGGGHYDRFLAGIRSGPPAPAVFALGVCFSVQLVDGLPAEAHDQRMDAVVTEQGRISTIQP